MNVFIQKVDGRAVERFMELIRVFEVVFEMENVSLPPSSYLEEVLNQNTFWVFVALIEDKVVGGLTAYVLPQYHSKRPLVYLYDLAVSPSYQRRGIGRQLVTGLTSYCRPLGVEVVFVQADGEDAEAVEFYRSTGGLGQEVVHFTYSLDK